MNKYLRDITPEYFLDWANRHPKEFSEFFNNEILDLIMDLEQDDYFGTEGFDQRFA